MFEYYPGIPHIYPDILDTNNEVILHAEDCDKIIIKISSEMMEKYPSSVQFNSFKTHFEKAIEREKSKREN